MSAIAHVATIPQGFEAGAPRFKFRNGPLALSLFVHLLVVGLLLWGALHTRPAPIPEKTTPIITMLLMPKPGFSAAVIPLAIPVAAAPKVVVAKAKPRPKPVVAAAVAPASVAKPTII